MPGMLKKYSTIFIILAASLAGVLLLQLWFEPFNDSFFWKFIFSILIIGGVLAFAIVVKSDLDTSDRQKKDKFLG